MLITMDYAWKEFSINGDLVLITIKTLSDKIVGTSHNSKFQIHFSSQPSVEELEAINDYWDSINEESEEATSYISGEQVKQNQQAENLALKESAKAKLLALGLSEAEVSAILGV